MVGIRSRFLCRLVGEMWGDVGDEGGGIGYNAGDWGERDCLVVEYDV